MCGEDYPLTKNDPDKAKEIEEELAEIGVRIGGLNAGVF